MSQHYVVAFVAGLLSERSPSTITGLVIPVVINPVKRKAEWFLTHVFQKLLELAPPVAYRNATGAVVAVLVVVGVVAALTHCVPALERRCVGASVRFISTTHSDTCVVSQAPARRSMSTPKVGQDNCGRVATFTSTQKTPDAFPGRLSMSLHLFHDHDRKSPELVARLGV